MGTDLLLVDLKEGRSLNIGNVVEFAFNRKGTYLAYTVGSESKKGNGIYLRSLASGQVQVLNSSEDLYTRLHWNKRKDWFVVLRGKKDKKYKDRIFKLFAFKIEKNKIRSFIVDPEKIPDFPEGMAISDKRTPYWSEVWNAVVFGIKELEPEEEKDGKDKKEKKEDPLLKDLKLPTLIIWHYKDSRLQSMQWVQEKRDRNFSYLCIYHFDTSRFIKLADRRIKIVRFNPKYKWAIGFDRTDYELEGNLSGKRYSDVYAIDPRTGQRRLILKKIRWTFQPSPDGTFLLFYKRDGNFYTVHVPTGKIFNLTERIPVSFIDEEDDHNVKNPPVRQYNFGWTKDGRFAILRDGWDLWEVSADGRKFYSLTGDGRKKQVRYLYAFILEKDFEGFDRKKPLYVAVRGQWDKKGGIARINLRRPGKKELLLWDDAAFGSLMKAEKAEIYLYTRQTYREFPDYYKAGPDFKKAEKITEANPQQREYRWCEGRKLIEYKNSEGKRLQAALYLPADYRPGRKYPTIVYIYEKLSDRLNYYLMPSEYGFNIARYTSDGYAVLLPDIVYKVNAPGLSAVDCVLAAVKAAIKTGVVDEKRLGLHGHSWGGYQTAFIITQTDIFKAAVAGAPLTNMISMYSSIYWNTGTCNQPIFESSQGRFKGGYWDYLEDYIKNSPVFFAKNVKTPLLLLHNDKDGAVDWNQGIEYYNTLRRLGKFVIMLEYKGENHGLRKKENRIDYGIRMKEFFDHFLKGKPAPEWMEKGVPYIKLKKHLKERKELIPSY